MIVIFYVQIVTLDSEEIWSKSTFKSIKKSTKQLAFLNHSSAK
jgi:hypothetical protein